MATTVHEFRQDHLPGPSSLAGPDWHFNYQERDDHAFRLESLAATHLLNQQINHQIALMDLNMQAIQAGLTSAWEVTLYPVPGNPHPKQV